MSHQEQWQVTAEAAELYQRYPARYILGPWAPLLVDAAKLTQGERVLDVACGTGLVTRIARGGKHDARATPFSAVGSERCRAVDDIASRTRRALPSAHHRAFGAGWNFGHYCALDGRLVDGTVRATIRLREQIRSRGEHRR